MTRGRPTKLTPDIGRQITRELDKQEKDKRPTFKAPGMRRHLLRMYRENLRKQSIPDDEIKRKVDYYEKKILPGVSSIQKFIAKIKNELQELDKPWSVLKFGDIQPQALPIVMKLAVAFKQHEEGRSITIREAKWASRLSSLYQAKDEYSLFKLFQLIQDYAWFERSQEIVPGADYSDIADVDDAELYSLLSGKAPNEPIFDVWGKEAKPEARRLIREGFMKTEKLKAKRGKKGGKSK